MQGRNEWAARGHNSLGAESLRGAPNQCVDTEKSQKCHKYFLQYSKFASERPRVLSWGRRTGFLPRTPSNLVTPLGAWQGCTGLLANLKVRTNTKKVDNHWYTTRFNKPWQKNNFLSRSYALGKCRSTIQR